MCGWLEHEQLTNGYTMEGNDTAKPAPLPAPAAMNCQYPSGSGGQLRSSPLPCPRWNAEGSNVVRYYIGLCCCCGELRVHRKYSEKYCFGQEHSILTHLTYFIEMSGPGGAEVSVRVLKCYWASFKTRVWALGKARCGSGMAECDAIHLWS